MARTTKRSKKTNKKTKKSDKEKNKNNGKEKEEKKKKEQREKKPIKAENVLKEKNKLEKTFTLTVPGIPTLRAGDLVKIDKNTTGIAGIFEVKSINHNFSKKYSFFGNAVYFMSLTLNLVEELEESE